MDAVRRGWAVLALAVLVMVGAPALWRGGHAVSKEPFDARPLAELRAQPPDYVFLGNSMLYTRIDPRHLGTLLEGRRVRLFAEGGSGSALWYLQLKNYVAPSGPRPRHVFVLFRDRELTEPIEGVDGPYRRQIERTSHESEPVYARVMAANRSGLDVVRSALEDLYPIQRSREGVEYRLHRAALAPFLAPGEEPAAVLERINGVFAVERLRLQPRTAARRTPGDFDAEVARSFLPPIVDLARAHGLAVTFVRVQRRPRADRPPEQPPELVAYVAALRRYIEAHGASFHDFTGDAEMPLAVYGEGDHIAAAHLARHTEVFARRLAASLR
jgi:hypothetical protein